MANMQACDSTKHMAPHLPPNGRASEFVLLNTRREAATSPRDMAWDILERFLLELNDCEAINKQIRATLHAVRAAVQADAVFWHPGSGFEGFEIAGKTDLTSEYCRGLVQRLITETGATDSQLLWTAQAGAPAFAPRSVAMVRISRSKSTWMVALNSRADAHFTVTDIRIMALARRMLLNQLQNTRVYHKLKDTLFGLVRCLTTAIDAKDPYTCGHSERVGRIAVRIGQQMKLSDEQISNIYLAGLLHDIGKIGIRDSVLQKPGALTEEEYDHVKGHVCVGDRILENIKQLRHLREGVRNHHERCDGKGYPDGLAGDAIPLLARVLAVADSCDAMMSARPYRPAMPTEIIDEIISKGAGTQWDPQVVEHFLACRHELYSIGQHGLGESVAQAVDNTVAIAAGDSAHPSKKPGRMPRRLA